MSTPLWNFRAPLNGSLRQPKFEVIGAWNRSSGCEGARVRRVEGGCGGRCEGAVTGAAANSGTLAPSAAPTFAPSNPRTVAPPAFVPLVAPPALVPLIAAIII